MVKYTRVSFSRLIRALEGSSAQLRISVVPARSLSYLKPALASRIQSADISVRLASPDRLQPKPDVSALQFGKFFTDHMLKIEYHMSAGGWQQPCITPLEYLSLHPAAKVLHYAIELFEGMKAYRGVDGQIRIFRPDLNMERMNLSAARSGLPQFDSEQMIRCICRLISIDQEWVPHSESASLYIRPTLIGTENNAAVESKNSVSDETTTATDILSQIISESLRTPAPPSRYEVTEDVKIETPQSKTQALLWHDVMKDLKELNDSFGSKDSKKTCYSETAWSKPVKPLDNVSKPTQYQNEFLKHLQNTQSNPPPPSVTTPPYSRGSKSTFENQPFLNEISKSIYNSSSHLSAQNMSSLAGSPGTKISQMSQGCIMKTLPNPGISSGRYITQEYGTDDQHLVGLGHYGLPSWPYTGNESQQQQ